MMRVVFVCLCVCDDEWGFWLRALVGSPVCVWHSERGISYVYENDMQIQHPTGYQEDLGRMSSNSVLSFGQVDYVSVSIYLPEIYYL